MTAAEPPAGAMAAAEVGAAAGEAREEREFAPAKVNLFLHVTGRRPDGLHRLESLVVFPAVGDELRARPAAGLALRVEGPFAAALADEADNLVLRAARTLAARLGGAAGAAMTLTKNLPVAAGIGGGSADAAAALRLLARLWKAQTAPGVLAQIAAGLGADVPVCLAAPAPRLVGGAGETLAPPPPMPGFWLVLANPRIPLSTPAVFAALRRRSNPPAGPMPRLDSFHALVRWLAHQRNDLEDAARGLCPEVGEVLAALDGAPLVRMSGSGATCFAVVQREAEARALAGRLAATRPRWWVAAAPVAPWPGTSR